MMRIAVCVVCTVGFMLVGCKLPRPRAHDPAPIVEKLESGAWHLGTDVTESSVRVVPMGVFRILDDEKLAYFTSVYRTESMILVVHKYDNKLFSAMRWDFGGNTKERYYFLDSDRMNKLVELRSKALEP